MKENSKDNKSEETPQSKETSDFEFLQERIKERPINKKKLFQRMAITASMALLFGVLACLSFLLLEPVLNNWLYPEEEPMVVTFPQEKDEMWPKDMLTEGSTTDVTDESETYLDERYEQGIPLQESAASATDEQTNISDAVTEISTEALSDVLQSTENTTDNILTNPGEEQTEEKPVEVIKTQYDELYSIYNSVSSSIVTVTAVHSETDWFNNTSHSEGTVAGVIIANNNKELLILTNKTLLEDAEEIVVSFCNGVDAKARIKKSDTVTDLTVLAVDLKYIAASTLDSITVATLGSSNYSGLLGSPVIAIGNIFGYKDSVCYGMITSQGNSVVLADNEYKLITTDIYAGHNPSGILVNLSGEVIGILNNSYNNEDTRNLVSALGITELKGMIGMLSNAQDSPYLGMYVKDISVQAKLELDIPQGAYISDIEMDSPAMMNGIQKGDILVKVGTQIINNARDYMNALRGVAITEPLDIVILRAGVEDYERMQFTVQPTLHPDAEETE